MRKLGAFIVAIGGGLAAALALSGGTSQVPQTPVGAEGLATPFLGVALLGSGGAAAAVDAYGSVVELRAPGPAGPAAIMTGYKRQEAGSVDERSGIVVRAAGDDGPPAPLWQTEPRQRYLGGGNVLETRGVVGGVELRLRDAMAPHEPVFAREIMARPRPSGARLEADGVIQVEASLNFDFGVTEGTASTVELDGHDGFTVRSGARVASCAQAARVGPQLSTQDGVVTMRWRAQGPLRISLLCRVGSEAPVPEPGTTIHTEVARTHAEARTDAHLALEDAVSLPADAPAWAHRLHRRSLLTLLALSDRESGAVPAGLRDHWHYIWPRDAGTAALALARAGLVERATRIADFLSRLDVEHAARFNEDGSPVEDGRHEQGDSIGWARLAQQAVGMTSGESPEAGEWRGRGDYGERDDDRGDFLANAIVAGASADVIEREFGRDGLLLRESEPGDPVLDTAAAWAVRPFPRPALYPLIRPTLLALADGAGPYGLFPASDWRGRDPWTAATASTAWSLAVLGERDAALRLMQALRNAATPLALLPERADIETGVPRSTTPLAWSHAFALLALQELWPPESH